MTIAMDKVNFVNDFFSTMLPDGSILILNKVDENFQADDTTSVVKAINIEIQETDGSLLTCPCVVGLGNDLMKIETSHTEYLGEVLTPDNMAYCTIEVYE